MPSIPQSLLWISLVVLWLFVLVPMLISKRDAVRRTSDVALATRVLNGGAGARLLKRGGPAAGHRWGYLPPEGQGDDPDWKPEEDWRDDPVEDGFADVEHDIDEDQEADDARRRGAVVMKVAAPQTAGADDAELQAITNALTPRPTRSSPMASACARISGMVSGPYGPLPVSPT